MAPAPTEVSDTKVPMTAPNKIGSTQWRGRVCRQSRLLRQAQVFQHQRRAEAARVIARRGRTVHDTGPRVVHFQGPVAARTLGHDI